MLPEINGALSQQVDAAIAEYLNAVKHGTPPARDEFIAQHKEIAVELEQFLADHHALDGAAQAIATRASTDNAANSTGRATRLIRPSLTGPQRFGNFELIEEIARGGMGVVYKARQSTPSRIVALKMILAGRFATQADIDRFEVEAHAAAALDHPNIVPIFEVGECEGQHYFTMAFIEGHSLGQRLAGGPLPAKEVATIIREVALAVEYAHRHGVIHRDLKPSNILIDNDGRVRVTDFGLAKQQTDAEGLTGTGELMGTPSFMSPEQVAGDRTQIGSASDIFSLGSSLYALVTGRPPFQAASTIDTLRQVVDQDPVRPRVLDKSIPRDLETITLKCLEKERGRRYLTASTLADDLERFLHDEPVEARVPSTSYRIEKFVRRNKVLFAALTFIAAAIFIGVGVAIWGLIKAHQGESLAEESAHNLNIANVQLASELARAESAEKLANSQAHELGRQVYEVKFPRAVSAFNEQQFKVASDNLNQCPTDLRDWEWHWLDRQVRANLPVLTLSGRQLAQFTPDGKQIVAVDAATENSVNFWDVSSGALVRTMASSPARITLNRLNLDGSQLAIGMENGSVALWDVPSGQLQWSIAAHNQRCDGLDFNMNGSRLASVSWDGTIKVFDTKDGREVAFGRVEEQSRLLQELRGVCFHPDGTRIITAKRQPLVDSASARVWDANNAQLLYALVGTWPRCAKYSPDGKSIVTGSTQGVVKLFDATTAKELRVIPSPNGFISAIDISPDNALVASAGNDSVVRIHDMQTGELVMSLCGHAATINYVDFSPDGQYLTSSDARSVVNVWDTKASKGVTTIRFHAIVARDCAVSSIAFSPNGDSLLVATEFGEVKVYEIESLAEKRILASAGCRAATFSGNGKEIATSAERSIIVWNVDSGEMVQRLEGHPDAIDSIRYSPDSRRLATANGRLDATIRIWDTATWRPLNTLRGHTAHKGRIRTAFRPDSKQIASVANDGLKIWDVESGALLHDLTVGGNLRCVTYSPNGSRVVAGGADGLVHVWDALSGKQLPSFAAGHVVEVSAVAYTTDGARIVSGDNTGVVIVWSAETGVPLLTLSTANGSIVDDLATSPNGDSIAAAMSDGTIRLWEINLSAHDSTVRRNSELASSVADSKLHTHRIAAEAISAILADESLSDEIKSLAARFAEKRVSAEQEIMDQNLLYVRDLAESPGTNDLVVNNYLMPLIAVEAERWRDPEATQRFMQIAVGAAKRAVQLAPQDGVILCTLGIVQFRAGEYRAAVDTLTKSVDLEGNDLRNHFCLAMAEWKLGNQTAAREWYRKNIAYMGQNWGEVATPYLTEAKKMLGVVEPAAAVKMPPPKTDPRP